MRRTLVDLRLVDEFVDFLALLLVEQLIVEARPTHV